MVFLHLGLQDAHVDMTPCECESMYLICYVESFLITSLQHIFRR